MSNSEILLVYLCILTLYPLSYWLQIRIALWTGEHRLHISRGEKCYVAIRLFVFFLVAALGWGLYFFSPLGLLIIPMTALLDFGSMFVMMLSTQRLIQYFDGKHTT